MRSYETVIVLRPDVPESRVKERVERLKSALVSHGAEILGVEEWGMRDLAYPIKKHEKGISVLLRYQVDTPGLRELERQIKFMEDIVRHITVRIEWEPKPNPPQTPEADPGSQAAERV